MTVRYIALLTGLLLVGHPVAGASQEGQVIEALIDAAGPEAQFSFYRTAAGAEIDLDIERGGQLAFAIEIKRSTAPKSEQGFYWGASDIGAARRIVITPGKDRCPLRDGAEVMPRLTALEEVAPGAAA